MPSEVDGETLSGAVMPDDVDGEGDDVEGVDDEVEGDGDDVDWRGVGAGVPERVGAGPAPAREPVGVGVGAAPAPPAGTFPGGLVGDSPLVSGGAVGLALRPTVGEDGVGTAERSRVWLRPGRGSRSPGLMGPPAKLKPSSTTYPRHSAPPMPMAHITHARRCPDSSTKTGD